MDEEVNNDQPIIDAAVEPTTPAVEVPSAETPVPDPVEPSLVDEPKPKTVPLPRFLQVNTEKNQLKIDAANKDAEIDRLKRLLDSNPSINQEAPIPTKEQLKYELLIETESTRILNTGNKAFGVREFGEILDAVKTVGMIDNNLVEIMADVGDGEKILQYLADNLDDAERIMNSNPTKRAIEIAKLHSKITAPPKRTVTNAPAPVTPIGGGTKFTGIDVNDKSLPVADRIREMNRLEQIEREKKYKR